MIANHKIKWFNEIAPALIFLPNAEANESCAPLPDSKHVNLNWFLWGKNVPKIDYIICERPLFPNQVGFQSVITWS